MKRNIFLTIAAIAMLLFSSCSKDIDLAGSKWKANYAKTITYQGIEMQVNMDFALNFVDATKYAMTATGSFSAMGHTENLNEETTEGTYTFDGENGMFDGEQSFSYNKKDKTITVEMEVDDPEVATILGDKISLVFTEVK